MKVGCVKEIKNNEFRVGMTPDNVKSYVNAGHDVYIEKGAGEGSGFLDAEYEAAGAKMIDTAKEVWDTVEMMIKVKEPLPEEYPLFHEGLILYTYLHLAADKPQTDALLGAKVKGVAYETLIERNGSIPLLAPMSQIAGRLSIQEGAKYLEKRFGGEGVLLAGVPGTPKANIVILGGGSVGTNACKIAVGMGANVTIMDINLQRLAYLDDIFGARIQTLVSNDANIEKAVNDRGLIKTVNQIINEKRLTKLQVYLILKTLYLSEIMVIKPVRTDEPDFEIDWLLKELKETNILTKEFWKAKLSFLNKER